MPPQIRKMLRCDPRVDRAESIHRLFPGIIYELQEACIITPEQGLVYTDDFHIEGLSIQRFILYLLACSNGHFPDVSWEKHRIVHQQPILPIWEIGEPLRINQPIHQCIVQKFTPLCACAKYFLRWNVDGQVISSLQHDEAIDALLFGHIPPSIIRTFQASMTPSGDGRLCPSSSISRMSIDDPPDTPLDEWNARVDALLAEIDATNTQGENVDTTNESMADTSNR